MKTLDKRIVDLEQERRGGPPIYVVVDTAGKTETETQREIDAAHARHPGKNVIVFVVRRDEPTGGKK